MGLRQDEAAAFAVVEAILVAILVFGAILFLGLSRRNVPDTSEGGQDLERLAADTLRILESTEIDGNGFEEWVTAVASGDSTTAGEVDTFLGDLLGTGVFYVVRLDNGHGTLPLLPYGTADDGHPQAARMARTFVVPPWHTQNAAAGLGTVSPGQATTLLSACNPASGHTLQGPMAATAGPGDSWLNLWLTEPGVVPDWAPFGLWSRTCTAGGVFCVAPAGSACLDTANPATERNLHAYGIELVVWTGA